MLTKRSLAQLLSSLGVILGLVFVGLQIRQSALATRAATVMALKETWVTWNLTLGSNPEMLRAQQAVADSGYANVDANTRAVFAAQWRSVFYMMSNAYSQYHLGTLDAEGWAPFSSALGSLTTQPRTWAWWDDWQGVYEPSFRVLMDSLRIANAGATRPDYGARGDP